MQVKNGAAGNMHVDPASAGSQACSGAMLGWGVLLQGAWHVWPARSDGIHCVDTQPAMVAAWSQPHLHEPGSLLSLQHLCLRHLLRHLLQRWQVQHQHALGLALHTVARLSSHACHFLSIQPPRPCRHSQQPLQRLHWELLCLLHTWPSGAQATQQLLVAGLLLLQELVQLLLQALQLLACCIVLLVHAAGQGQLLTCQLLWCGAQLLTAEDTCTGDSMWSSTMWWLLDVVQGKISTNLQAGSDGDEMVVCPAQQAAARSPIRRFTSGAHLAAAIVARCSRGSSTTATPRSARPCLSPVTTCSKQHQHHDHHTCQQALATPA